MIDNSADTKVRGEGEGGGASSARVEIPLQSMVETVVKQLGPCNPWRDVEIYPQPMEETHARARACLRGGCGPVGDSWWSNLLSRTCRSMESAGFLVGLVTLWGSSLSFQDCTPWKSDLCCSSLCRVVACGKDSQ